MAKGRQLHRLPVNRPAADALLAYLADRDDVEPALFLNRSQRRFSVRGIALLVNRYLRAAGITDRSRPHLLRHTFATTDPAKPSAILVVSLSETNRGVS